MLRQLHTLDSLFLHLDAKNSQMDIAPVYFYDPSTAPGGELSHQQLLAHLSRSIELLPVMRCRLERTLFDLDNPYLAEDKRFDIHNHIRQITLPEQGDWRKLCEIVADFQAEHLDTSRPLWEILVVRGLNGIESLPKGCFMVMMKIHHVVADGHTIMEITSRMHDEGLAQIAKSGAQPAPDFEAPELFSRVSRLVSNNLIGAVNMLNPLMKTSPIIGKKVIEKVLKSADTISMSPVRTRFNHCVDNDRVWDFVNFKLSDFKVIRKQIPGTTLNDVVLAVVTGAMREYLLSKGESVEECLRAIAPINVRQEHENNQAGNEVALFFPDLPLQIEDPLACLKAVTRSAANAKKIAEEVGSRDLSDVAKNMPPAYISYLIKLGNFSTTSSTVLNHAGHSIVTNVPGPPVTLHMAGAQLVQMTGMLPVIDCLGLNHAINSYDGQLNMSLTSCPKMMPDPEFYADCLRHSFARLHQATQPAEQVIESREEVAVRSPVADKTESQGKTADNIAKQAVSKPKSETSGTASKAKTTSKGTTSSKAKTAKTTSKGTASSKAKTAKTASNGTTSSKVKTAKTTSRGTASSKAKTASNGTTSSKAKATAATKTTAAKAAKPSATTKGASTRSAEKPAAKMTRTIKKIES